LQIFVFFFFKKKTTFFSKTKNPQKNTKKWKDTLDRPKNGGYSPDSAPQGKNLDFWVPNINSGAFWPHFFPKFSMLKLIIGSLQVLQINSEGHSSPFFSKKIPAGPFFIHQLPDFRLRRRFFIHTLPDPEAILYTHNSKSGQRAHFLKKKKKKTLFFTDS